MSFNDDLHDSGCYNYMGFLEDWKTLKMHWSGWEQTWSCLVSDTSDGSSA